MAIETRTFNASFMGQWRGSTNSYYGGGSPVRVGGGSLWRNFIGIPPAVREAIQSAKAGSDPVVKMRVYVTDNAYFKFGVHSLTSNPASGTVPSWADTMIPDQLWLSGGYREVTLSNYSTFITPYLNGIRHGIVLYGKDTDNDTNDVGLADNTTERPIQFTVTAEWNSAPPVPTVTYPTGGEVVDTSLTVMWNGVSDPDGDTVGYQITIRRAGTIIDSALSYGTSYTFNTSNWAEGSDYRVWLQSGDGEGNISTPFTSNLFIVAHNSAPFQPTNLSPASNTVRDRTQGIQLSWRHSDDGQQAGYELRYRLLGASNWTTLTSSAFVNSTNESHFVAANTFPTGTIEWAVRTKDQQNLASPWSNSAVFKALPPSVAPIITFPNDGSSVNSTYVGLSWSSLAQQAFEIRLRNVTDNVILNNYSGNSQAKSYYPNVALVNGKVYEYRIRVQDSNTSIWSDYSYTTFTASFTPPAQPVLSTVTDSGAGVVTIQYTGTTGTTTTDSIAIYRREYSSLGIEPWIKVAENLPFSGGYIEYTLASGIPYEFKAVAHNNTNDTSSESAPLIVTIEFVGAIVQEANNLSNIHVMSIVNSREEDYEVENESNTYAGRTSPVTEFGEHEFSVVSIEWELDELAELRQIKTMIKKRGTLLYRDGSGRRYWVTAGKLTIKDKDISGFVVNTDFTETQFYEDLDLMKEELN